MENGNGHHGVTVREAAKTLGISPRAVRFRLQKNQLKGAFLDGQWMVFLGAAIDPDESPETEEVTGNFRATDYLGNGNGAPQSSSMVAPPFQAVMTEWVSPLVEKISLQAEEIGKLKAENEQRDRELVALREALEAMQDDISQYADEARPGFWGWLFGR
jgi:hypothetical protein